MALDQREPTDTMRIYKGDPSLSCRRSEWGMHHTNFLLDTHYAHYVGRSLRYDHYETRSLRHMVIATHDLYDLRSLVNTRIAAYARYEQDHYDTRSFNDLRV